MALLLLCLLASPGVAQTLLARPGEPGWTRTDEGCFVWNPAPAPGETASWSGPCVDRRASGAGTLVWRREGHARVVYVGEMRFGRLNGAGVFRLPEGDRYEGEFVDDQLTGRGTLTTAQGNEYKGDFKGFRMEGQGVFRYANGDRYEGAFAHDLPNGKGRAIWPNGEKFEGMFRDGIPDGYGTLTTPSQSYAGTWTRGCFREGNRRRAVMVPAASCS